MLAVLRREDATAEAVEECQSLDKLQCFESCSSVCHYQILIFVARQCRE